MSNYIVNWALSGFRKAEHEAGTIIVAAEHEAEEIASLVKIGVLSLVAKTKKSAAVAVDLTTSTADELIAYALEIFKVKLDSSLSKDALLAEIASLEAGTEATDDGTAEDIPNKPVAQMNKSQLIAYAKSKHNFDLKPTLSNAAMRAEIASLEAE